MHPVPLAQRRRERPPYFSVCIPQYSRTDFLLKALASYEAQGFTDFEICISDDCSPDDRLGEIVDALRSMEMDFVVHRTETNLRYDGNLRRAIALSRGRYILLMGNDDALSHADVLQQLRDFIDTNESKGMGVGAVLTNFREIPTGAVRRRVAQAGVIGAGRATAVRRFRDYSFVSGVVLHGAGARDSSTADVDGSEMYQMYLATRLVSSGLCLLGFEGVCVDKDVQVEGMEVDSYRQRKVEPGLRARPLPMGRLLEVVAKGIRAGIGDDATDRELVSIARQLYGFTYPFWAIEYRRIHSLAFALGVYWPLRPARVLRGIRAAAWVRMSMCAMYVSCGLAALVFPVRAFDALRPLLYRWAKR